MLERLLAIPHLSVSGNVPLRRCTRFEIGGPAGLLADASSEDALVQALQVIRETGAPWALIGGGSNLIADDAGFSGVVLRYTANAMSVSGNQIHVGAGAVLQDLVDLSIASGLGGIQTMTGIPGWVGGAVYGNAGAYGNSIHQRVQAVRVFDGAGFRDFSNAECEFAYRESVFKRHKDWIIVSAVLTLDPANPGELRAAADKILDIRNAKYPPTMRCAGSIFKNLILSELSDSVRAQVPERVIREGKVPSAYFLEQAGAKGLADGPIRVADYHANLIYNEGGGTAAQVRSMISLLKKKVHERFGLTLEEEVQLL